LPGLRLDPDSPSAPQGLVFRKPPELRVRWAPHGNDILVELAQTGYGMLPSGPEQARPSRPEEA